MSKIGTLVTGDNEVTTIQIPYVPEILSFVAATTPKKVTVNVAGDGVICQLDANGIDQVSRYEQQGNVTNQKRIRLADGIVLRKNTTIEIVNSAAQTPDIYGTSTKRGNLYLQSILQTVFADSGQDFDDFLSIGFTNSGSDDLFNVTFRDRTTERLKQEEFRMLMAQAFNVANNSNDLYMFNASGRIKMIDYNPTEERKVYLQRWKPTRGAIKSEV